MLGRIIGATARRVRRGMVAPGSNGIVAANRHRDAARWEDAAKGYWLALDRFPKRADLWVQYGHALKELRDFEASERAYRWAAELAPNDADPQLHLGHVLKLQGRFEEARQAYAVAASINPGDSDIERELSATEVHYAIAAGDHARDSRIWHVARQFYAMAVEGDSRLADIWIQLGHVCRELGDFAAAETAYSSALIGGPRDAVTWSEIGHARKLKGDFDAAVTAFARAIISGNVEPSTRRELDHLTGFCAVEAEAALQSAFVQAHGDGAYTSSAVRQLLRRQFAGVTISSVDPTGARRRHAALVREAAAPVAAGAFDVIWLPNIDWGYRTQRAQHLAGTFAARGHRVFFISPTAERAEAGASLYRLIAQPAAGVFEVRLRLPGGGRRPLDRPVDDVSAKALADSIRQLCTEFVIRHPVLVAQQPSWQPVIAALPRWKLVYDCLDDQAAFPNAPESVVPAHERMIDASDLVVTTSSRLQAEIAERRTCVLIRNATSHAMLASTQQRPTGKPVIGYFGALAEWFEMDWIVRCAEARRDWRFVLAGEIGACEAAKAKGLPNVTFAGEIAYSELPALLATFSVGIIPFKISRLTEVTDPVKLYEYMAGGCPVVASAMPEVMALGAPGVRFASSAAEFEKAIADSLKGDTDAARRERMAWAKGNTWMERATTMEVTMREHLTPPRQLAG